MPESDELLPISAADLAEHWGITERRLRDLTQEGVAVRGRAGFDLRESDRRYIAKLRSHDEARRLKAKLIERQTQRQEIRLHQDAATLLSRAQAQEQCESWWGVAWQAANSAISRLYYSLPGSDDERRATCWRIANDLRGELLIHRDTIKDVFLAPSVPRTLDQHLHRLGINGTDPTDDE